MRTLCFAWFLFSSFPVIAQQTNPFEAFTTKDGLSENVVTCVYQDIKGLLWFGTYDGLNCYDGYHFRIYRHDAKDSLSLPGGHVGNIMQDKNGNLWIVTEQGTGILDAATGKMKTLLREKTLLPDLVKLFDAGNDKMLFISNKVVVYNKKTREITSLYLPGQKPESYVTAACSFKGNIYAAIRGNEDCFRLGKFDNTQNTFHPSEEFPLINLKGQACIFIENLFVDARQRLWISERNSIKGRYFLHVINMDGSVNKISNVFAKISNHVYPVAQGIDGSIWLISYEGLLYRWDDRSQKLDTVLNRENYGCIAAVPDNKNILWLGTKGKGVLKYNPLKQVFNQYTVSTSPQRLHRNIILGLYPTGNKYLLALHDDNIISKINITNGEISSLSNTALPNAAAYWSEWNRSMKTFNKPSLIDILKKTENQPYLLFPNFIVTPSCTDILYCDFAGGALKNIGKYQTTILDSVTYVWHAWQGDTLWICNEVNGLAAVHYPDYAYRRYLKNNTDPFSIASDKIRCILFASTGNLWIATDNGLDYLDKVTQKFSHHTEKDGLCNNTIYCMAYDRKGRIWLGTGNGLSCFDTASKKFINFYTTDGLVNSEYNRRSAWLAPDGRMFMGGTEGIDYFDPDKLIFNAEPPKVIITDFSLYDVHYSPENLPEFSHYNNNITISFAADDYSYPAGSKYLYKLEGADNDWILMQGENSVHYSLLPPGNYTFKVKAANHRGVWNQKPAEVFFTILPPWYNTWWFYTLSAFAGGILIYFFMKAYTKRTLQKQRTILEKKQAVEMERLRISSELHDDLGGGLSTIRLLSEMIKEKANAGNIQLQIGKISDSSRELVQKMNEIVWALNVSNDNLQSLVIYIRQYAVSFLDDIEIACKADIPEDVPEIPITGNNRRDIFLVIKEALNNIAKHAGATKVELKIWFDDALHISIHDNGKGIPEQIMNGSSGNGLANMRRRVKELQSDLSIQNHDGTTVLFSVPLHTLSHKSVTD